MYCSLLEGKRHQSLANKCDMSFATSQSKSSALLFFKKLLLTTVCNKIGWKAKIKRKGGKNGMGTNVTSPRRHVGSSMTVIS